MYIVTTLCGPSSGKNRLRIVAKIYIEFFLWIDCLTLCRWVFSEVKLRSSSKEATLHNSNGVYLE